MSAVIGYLVVGGIATFVALLAARSSPPGPRDPTFPVEDVAARHVSILGALAAFAVTAIVLLVTQSRTLPDAADPRLTTVIVMVVVAYMGYFSSSILFANVAHRAESPVFDLAAAQYAGASISMFSVFLGWLALKPLFETFGLDAVADASGWLLTGAVIGGYGLLGAALFRSGYASARLVVVLGIVAFAATAGYALFVSVLAPGLGSPESALYLSIVAFLAGVPAYAAMTLLPVAASQPRTAEVLATHWHLAVIGYAQAVMVLVGFVLLAVLGLA